MEKEVQSRLKMSLRNLQLFAEGGEGSIEPGAGTDGVDSGNPTDPVQPAYIPPADQSEEDARINKAVQKALANQAKKFEGQQQSAIDAALEQAQKLQNMSDSEKLELQNQELQAELQKLKDQAALTEMSKVARSLLADQNIAISDTLLERLVSLDAEETQTAVDAFAKDFQAAVSDQVKAIVRQTTPAVGAGGTSGTNYGASLGATATQAGGTIF